MYHQDIDNDKQDVLDYFAKHKHVLKPSEDLTKPPEEDEILLPDYVYGFVLRSRKWGKVIPKLL